MVRAFSVFIVMLLIGVIAILIFGLKYSELLFAPADVSREIVVNIPAGAGVNQIGEILEENKVIKSAKAFNIAFKLKNRFSKKPISLKAGEMALDPSLNIWETIDLIAKGNYKVYPFTIPEGKNMVEIATLVENAGLGSKENFLKLARDPDFIKSLKLDVKDLEGYLFPETYNFPKSISQEEMIRQMVGNFFNVWKKHETKAAKSSLNRHEIITLASIVEKETGASFERPLIAGVFFNRLKKGMRLETDPTVVYGLSDYTGVIRKSDLKDPHPYNTYIHYGLPPGPIANPGEAAIEAVLNPEKSDYLFFVSKNDGTHHFSKNLAEHNKMVNIYQR